MTKKKNHIARTVAEIAGVALAGVAVAGAVLANKKKKVTKIKTSGKKSKKR